MKAATYTAVFHAPLVLEQAWDPGGTRVSFRRLNAVAIRHGGELWHPPVRRHPSRRPTQHALAHPVPARGERTLTRRGVLAGAVTGGAAVAAARLLLLQRSNVQAGFGHIAPQTMSDKFGRLHNPVLDPVNQAALVAQPPPATTTSQVEPAGTSSVPAISAPLLVSQALRRLAFGGTDALLQLGLAQGLPALVDNLLNTPAEPPPPFPGGEALGGKQATAELLMDWAIGHMLASPTPFHERLALVLHDLFPSDHRRVGLDTPFLVWQHRAWLDMALTDLRSILYRASIDPAMLIQMDADGSNGNRLPSQHYARVLLERFTIGLNYTELDVAEGARALSGWRVPRAQDNSRVGIFEAARHFSGTVAFLGRSQPMDLNGVIDAILNHDACAPFIAARFAREFVTPNPDQSFVDRLAASFRGSGYQMRTLLRDILLSPEFASQANYRGLVRAPLDHMVSAARLVGADPVRTAPLIRAHARAMGQAPFEPQGEVGGLGWLTPVGLLQRVNFATDLVAAQRAFPATAAAMIPRYLDGVLSPGLSAAFTQAKAPAQQWWSVIASPDAQLA